MEESVPSHKYFRASQLEMVSTCEHKLLSGPLLTLCPLTWHRCAAGWLCGTAFKPVFGSLVQTWMQPYSGCALKNLIADASVRMGTGQSSWLHKYSGTLLVSPTASSPVPPDTTLKGRPSRINRAQRCFLLPQTHCPGQNKRFTSALGLQLKKTEIK